MSARGRKAQLIPAGAAIASELEQERQHLLEDMQELSQYFSDKDGDEPDEIDKIFFMGEYLQRAARLQAVG